MRKLIAAAIITAGLAAVLSAPTAQAGSGWVAEPSGDYTRHPQADQDAHPPANTWENVTFDAGLGQGTCWQQIRFGMFGTPPILNAYSQIRYVAGNCSWGGIDLAYLDGWGYVRHLLPDENQKCVAQPGGTQGIYCVQLGDGSLWVQRSESRSSQALAAKAVICQTSGNGIKYCLRKTISINF